MVNTDIRKNYGIYNETFKQLYNSISVWITGLKVILLSYIFRYILKMLLLTFIVCF